MLRATVRVVDNMLKITTSTMGRYEDLEDLNQDLAVKNVMIIMSINNGTFLDNRFQDTINTDPMDNRPTPGMRPIGGSLRRV